MCGLFTSRPIEVIDVELYRDDHFARVLVEIAHHLGTTSESGSKCADAKIVDWAHNSHIGDARATDMGKKRGKYQRDQKGLQD